MLITVQYTAKGSSERIREFIVKFSNNRGYGIRICIYIYMFMFVLNSTSINARVATKSKYRARIIYCMFLYFIFTT